MKMQVIKPKWCTPPSKVLNAGFYAGFYASQHSVVSHSHLEEIVEWAECISCHFQKITKTETSYPYLSSKHFLDSKLFGTVGSLGWKCLFLAAYTLRWIK